MMLCVHETVVIGGGVVGIAVAHAVAARGASVTVLERHAAPGMACSAGNAGIVGSRHVEPLANLGALWEGVQALPRRGGPLAIRVKPSTLTWIGRFAAAALRERDGHAAAALRQLAEESAALHRGLGERLDTGWTQRGFLSVYRHVAAFEAARRSSAGSQVLDAHALRSAYPQLAEPLAGGVLDPDEAHCDPQGFVSALAGEAASEHGVTFMGSTEVLGFRARDGRVDRLLTSRGELRVGTVIVAAGAWSSALLRGLPVTLPLQGGKGYHVELPAEPGDPDLPVYLPEQRVVMTPLHRRVRVAGTLEIAGTDERVSMPRVDAVMAAATRQLPSLGGRRPLHVWRGLRPCTPDGLPAVGRVPRVANLVLATGHGMWGLQLAPVTGRVVADLLEGRLLDGPEEALRPERFARRPPWTTSARRRGPQT
jgi:D-amino-acid dehydrogenase